MKPDFTDEIQEKLYNLLCRDTATVDSLADQTGYEITSIINALGNMEIDGIIINIGGTYRVL